MQDLIKNLDKNIFISAGAGTGKTHILVQRYLYLLSQKKAQVSEILAITFTEKAAKEMKDRIRNLCSEEHKRELENSLIGTIHGFCAKIIKENPVETGIDPESDILDESGELILINKVVHNHVLKLLEENDSKTIDLVKEYGFGGAKNIIKTLIKNRIDSSAYEDYKKREGLIDFDDLIVYTQKLLRENKEIRKHYQKTIKYILVDEYQDTDFRQKDIIFLLAAGSKNKLFIVGDSKQSIYRFRGADVAVFENTKKELNKTADFYELNVNRRSLPQHIEFFNDLFGGIMKQGKEDYEIGYSDILPLREERFPEPVIEFINVNSGNSASDTRNKEAELIAERILSLKFPFKDIAILFRAMTDIKLYEEVFRKYKIPYYVIAGSGFFGRQEIKDVINYLKVIDNENDKISLAGILRSPMFGLNDNELYLWSKDKKTPANVLSLIVIKDKISISSLIEEIVVQTNYRAILAAQYMGEQKILNINKLIETARSFEAKGIFTLKDFITYLTDLVVNEARTGEAAISGEEDNVVKIMTIHKAKGLEFPVVIIPDIQRKQRPISGPVLFDSKFNGIGLKKKNDDGEWEETSLRKQIKEEIEKKELEESKRLLYVASTRVKEYLIYSGNFDDGKSNWAKRLAPYLTSPIVKVTEISEAMPCAPSSYLETKQNQAMPMPEQQILKQIEPLPAYPKTRITATETSFHGPESAIKTHKFLKEWDFKDAKHPIFEEIRQSDQIMREVPITYKDDGCIIEGVIDLLYKKKNGDWVLLDYKTDNITKEEAEQRANQYKTQISRYAKGIEKIMGITLEKKLIFFITPGIAIPL